MITYTSIVIFLSLLAFFFIFNMEDRPKYIQILDKLFISKEWYRQLFSTRTFVLVKKNNLFCWKDLVQYHKGEYIKDVCGNWNNLIFCQKCRNELIYSNSHTSSLNNEVEEFTCTCCGEKQHVVWGIIPGYLHCNEQGIPI